MYILEILTEPMVHFREKQYTIVIQVQGTKAQPTEGPYGMYKGLG